MRLVAFGDSWTAGHGVEKDIKYKEIANPPWFIEGLRMLNSWPRWTANRFDCEFINLGVCGFGNDYIYKFIKESIDNDYFEKDDLVVVMLSYPYRYKNEHDVVKIYNEMESILNGYKHFYFNSFYPSFKNEDFDTTKLPDYFINPNGSVSDILREYEIKNNVSVWEYESRSVWNDEKNFWEGDYHPNFLGYKLIGNYIYEEINKILKL